MNMMQVFCMLSFSVCPDYFIQLKNIKMISTLLFAAAIIGAIVIVVLLLSYVSKNHRRKETEKNEKYFSKAASVFGVSITKKDLLQHRMIGLDEQGNRVLFVDYSKQPLKPVLIALKDIADSRLIVNNDTVIEKVRGEDKVTDIFISSVKLRLQFKNNHLDPADLAFYRYGVDSFHDLQYLKQEAESWNELINENTG